jgi:membrane-associated HD superfamily phosphohydrolase
LTPNESATQIIDHVSQGVLLGKKYKLPKVILDFIETHHGTSLVNFFYQKAKSLNRENIDDGIFKYKGPLPISKEQTILMLADSLEAASRTLGDNNQETIDNFVEKIISYKIGEGQLYQSELTFSELSEIKKVFIENLKALYHQRIVYPG